MSIRVPDLPPWYFGAGLSLWVFWLVACVLFSRRFLLGGVRWWAGVAILVLGCAIYGAVAAIIAEQVVVRTRLAQSRATFGGEAAKVELASGPLLLRARARLSEGWNRDHTALVTSSDMEWTFDPRLPLVASGASSGGAAVVFGLSCVLWAGKGRAPGRQPS